MHLLLCTIIFRKDTVSIREHPLLNGRITTSLYELPETLLRNIAANKGLQILGRLKVIFATLESSRSHAASQSRWSYKTHYNHLADGAVKRVHDTWYMVKKVCNENIATQETQLDLTAINWWL